LPADRFLRRNALKLIALIYLLSATPILIRKSPRG